MTSPNEKSSAPFQLSKKRDSVIDQIGFQRRVDEVNLVGDANLWDKNLHGGMQSRLIVFTAVQTHPDRKLAQHQRMG